MRTKAAFVVGAGFGYVLGTRAGRERYERIRGAARAVWTHPLVQKRVSGVEGRAADLARAQSAAVIDRLADAAKSLLHAGAAARRASEEPARSGTAWDPSI